MLAAPPKTPRPRPPARVRRISNKLNLDEPIDPSLLSIPPPPYDQPPTAPSPNGSCRIVETVTTTTSTTTTTFMGDEEPNPLDMQPLNEWFKQRSRDELSHMLLQAERIIRARETELSNAAESGKALRGMNEALKAKHDALRARIPSSPGGSNIHRSRSSSISSFSEEAGLGVPSPPLSPKRFQTPLRTHARGPSTASPAALAFLSVQNDELQSRIADLESETTEANQSGKKKLRKLEKEIDALKLELEMLEHRNGELERQVQSTQPLTEDEEEQERKRLEREERARVIRAQVKRHDDSIQQYRDFAPSSSRKPLVSFRSPLRNEHSDDEYDTDGPPLPQLSTILSACEDEETPAPSRPSTIGAAAGETAVVVQLLAKIEELEGANKELSEQNAKTKNKLKRAGQDVDTIRLAFEGFEDEVNQAELSGDLVYDEEGWGDLPSPTGTANRLSLDLSSIRSIRSSDVMSSSLKRMSMPDSSSIRSFTSKGTITPRSHRIASRRGTGGKGMQAKKARKALHHHMFVSPAASQSGARTPSSPVSSSGFSQRTNGHLRPPRLSFGPGRSGRSSSSSSQRSGIFASLTSKLAPGASAGGGSTLGSLADYVGTLGGGGRTLSSELGLGEEFGEDWGIDVNQSLFGDEGALLSEGRGGRDSDTEGDQPAVNAAIAALQAAMDRRGEPLEVDEHILPVGCLRASPAETFFGLNCAISARPTRWVDISNAQRLLMPNTESSTPAPPLLSVLKPKEGDDRDPWEATLYPSELESNNPLSDSDDEYFEVSDISPAKPTPKGKEKEGLISRRDDALLRLNHTFNSRRLSTSSVKSNDDENGRSGKEYEVVPKAEKDAQYRSEQRPIYDPVSLADRLQKTSLRTFLEVWMILQFVLVIGVFVYTSMRQGPRVIMGSGAGKRKTN